MKIDGVRKSKMVIRQYDFPPRFLKIFKTKNKLKTPKIVWKKTITKSLKKPGNKIKIGYKKGRFVKFIASKISEVWPKYFPDFSNSAVAKYSSESESLKFPWIILAIKNAIIIKTKTQKFFLNFESGNMF